MEVFFSVHPAPLDTPRLARRVSGLLSLLRPSLFLLLSSLFFLTHAAYSQTSPCNQGRAKPPRIDPRDPDLVCVSEIARRFGLIQQCRLGYEDYGGGVGRIRPHRNGAPNSWIVRHVRCDTVGNRDFDEALVYRSEPGTIPASSSGIRLGPREIASTVRVIATGDWDNSGTTDICMLVQLYGDTSAGNVGAHYDIRTLIVFWADDNGVYSIDDTTQLQCDCQRWGYYSSALGTDRNGDGIDDLFVMGEAYGFSDGAPRAQAQVFLFHGQDGRRWGRDGVSRLPSWRWWRVPITTDNFDGYYSWLGEQDQDGDGNYDVVLYGRRTRVDLVRMGVLYGRAGPGDPDTMSFEDIELTNTNAHAVLLTDVSGDGIPELIAHCGSEEQLAIFVGQRGMRLREQYGPGHEVYDTATTRWWRKPFARVWLPPRINDAWIQSTWSALYDLGDGNNDHIRDIWVHCKPFLLCYSSGKYLDSLVDGIVDLQGLTGLYSAAQLGRVLDDTTDVIAIGGGNAVLYVRPSSELPNWSARERRWPEGTLSGAETEPVPGVRSNGAIRARVEDGSIVVDWDGVLAVSEHVELSLYDMMGRLRGVVEVRGGDGRGWIETEGVPSGSYIVTARGRSVVGSVAVMILR